MATLANRPARELHATTPTAPAKDTTSVKDAGVAAQVVTSDAVKAGDPPVDAERVATIRRAIDEGKYPVLPVKIADAMIAAGMLLRKPD